MKHIQTTTSLFICLFLAISTCMAEPFSLERTSTHQVASKETQRTHELIVQLPQGYEKGEKSYPVVFLLDAYWDFALLSGTYGVLQSDNVIPEVILVGLSYPSSTDINSVRGMDLFPFTESKNSTTPSPSSQKFSLFLKKTALPFIEKKYRTNTENYTIAGHSLAGLFILSTLKETPSLFKNHIALSPAVIAGEVDLKTLPKNPKTRLYVAYGENEYKPYKDSIVEYMDYLKSIPKEQLTIKTQQLDGLRHSSVKIHGYARGLKWALKDITPKKISGMEAGFRSIEEEERKMKAKQR